MSTRQSDNRRRHWAGCSRVWNRPYGMFGHRWFIFTDIFLCRHLSTYKQDIDVQLWVGVADFCFKYSQTLLHISVTCSHCNYLQIIQPNSMLLSHSVTSNAHTVTEKWDCRRKVRQSQFCASLTFLQHTFLWQCGQGLSCLQIYTIRIQIICNSLYMFGW